MMERNERAEKWWMTEGGTRHSRIIKYMFRFNWRYYCDGHGIASLHRVVRLYVWMLTKTFCSPTNDPMLIYIKRTGTHPDDQGNYYSCSSKKRRVQSFDSIEWDSFFAVCIQPKWMMVIIHVNGPYETGQQRSTITNVVIISIYRNMNVSILGTEWMLMRNDNLPAR